MLPWIITSLTPDRLPTRWDGSAANLDHRRPEHLAVPRVAGSQDLADDRLAFTGLVQHGIGEVRVEWLLVQVHRFETLLLQLTEHQVEQRFDLCGVLQERGFASIEHR